MRLQGYPASKISILTTYNGQKHLIRDVIKQRYLDFHAYSISLTKRNPLVVQIRDA